MRWKPAVSAAGAEEVARLWGYCGDRKTLMVVGAGFDPRVAVAYEAISEAASEPVDLLRIRLDHLSSEPATRDWADRGAERLEQAAAQVGVEIQDQPPVTEGSSSGMVVAREFFASGRIDEYEQVVVDVSALPRTVYFPIVRGLLELGDEERKWNGALHVIACDNPPLDRLVTGDGVESAEALPGFGHHDPSEKATRIWVPLLGEEEVERFDALNEDIDPSEICPVLPFPAANPRRADDLVKEFREHLFDRIRVEPRNIIYAAESNPLDLYRQLSKMKAEYEDLLAPLGEVRMILSALSSKLLSVGVLLAAYELGLEVRHVSPSTYALASPERVEAIEQDNYLVDVWLTGEPYA